MKDSKIKNTKVEKLEIGIFNVSKVQKNENRNLETEVFQEKQKNVNMKKHGEQFKQSRIRKLENSIIRKSKIKTIVLVNANGVRGGVSGLWGF